ncbi:MAG: PIN domain-containing protein [Nanoarchaeota archaeon]
MSQKRFYFDTSIWLDFLENRNEPNFPKSEWVKALVEKITREESKIILSDTNILELECVGCSRYEIEDLFGHLKQRIVYVESKENQIGKAKDLSAKRKIPKRDALHAILARDNHAFLITFDEHFKELADILKSHRTDEFI